MRSSKLHLAGLGALVLCALAASHAAGAQAADPVGPTGPAVQNLNPNAPTAGSPHIVLAANRLAPQLVATKMATPAPTAKGGSLSVIDIPGNTLLDPGVAHVTKTDAEWKKLLTSEQYEVARRAGTERAFTGALEHNKAAGTYVCVCCGNPLFSSDTKFDSGTGWPSFWAPLAPSVVASKTDRTLMMSRTEVLCSRCDAHLGHVFDDGPAPTHLRYCMNSAALRFVPKK